MNMLDQFERRSSNEGRQREQVSMMENAASGAGGAPSSLKNFDPDMTQELSEAVNAPRAGRHAPPSGAIENARKFLWDEDAEEEEEKEIPIRPIDWQRPQTNFGSRKSVDSNKTPPPPERYGPEFGIVAGVPSTANTQPTFGTRARTNNRGSNNSGKHRSSFGEAMKNMGMSIRGFVGVHKEQDNAMDAHANIAPRKYSKDAMDMSNLEQVSLDPSDRATEHLNDSGSRLCTARRKAVACIAIAACVAFSVAAVLITKPLDLFHNDPDRRDDIKTRIVSSGISHEKDLNMEGTPQYEALTWISKVDGAKLDPNDDFILQRYSLAVFFFSTYVAAEEQDREEKNSKRLPDGITLSNAWDGTVEKPTKGWKNSKHWMSSKGYCIWEGVSCHHRPGTDYSDTRYNENARITHIDLQKNSVRGKIPDEIGYLEHLRLLHLGDNYLTGTIPATFGNLRSIVSMNLESNHLIGNLPSTLGEMQDLTHLYLQKNELGGEVPHELNSATNLQVLSLYKNNFRGSIPDFRPLKRLTDLYLDDNNFNGKLPKEMGELGVKALRVSSNWLTGPLPDEIGDMKNLEILHIDRNELTGRLPSTLSKLDRLEKFHAFENQFSGQLPYQLGSLENLQVLYLDNNQFTGSIPKAWGGTSTRVGMQDLQQLYLFNNKLKGKIPAEIGKMEDLRNIQLHNNQITGAIPTEFGRLYKLKYAYLDQNKINGEVPAEIGKLSKLERLRLNGNDITGKVSDEICDLRGQDGKLKELHSDCDGAEPEVKCDCCTQCFKD